MPNNSGLELFFLQLKQYITFIRYIRRFFLPFGLDGFEFRIVIAEINKDDINISFREEKYFLIDRLERKTPACK